MACGRHKQGRPLSALDGVPYTVIDGMDALPYPTTAGTIFVRPTACLHLVCFLAVLAAPAELVQRPCPSCLLDIHTTLQQRDCDGVTFSTGLAALSGASLLLQKLFIFSITTPSSMLLLCPSSTAS